MSLLFTPCEIGDKVTMNGKEYTCGGFIIGASGANVNLYDDKLKLYQPSFAEVRAAIFTPKGAANNLQIMTHQEHEARTIRKRGGEAL